MRKLITLFVAVCMAVGANAVTVVDYEKDFTDGTYAMWHSEATDISSRFKIDTKRVYRIIGITPNTKVQKTMKSIQLLLLKPYFGRKH